MADSVSSRRSPLSPAWRPVVQSVAGVAALFCLVVSTALIVNQLRILNADPLNAPGLLEDRRQFANAPDDDALKNRIRQEDWQARQMYFSAQGRAGTGAVLLLGGALVLLVSLAVIPLTVEPAPDPERFQNSGSEWHRRRSARMGLMLGIVILAVMVALLTFLAGGDFNSRGSALLIRSVPP